MLLAMDKKGNVYQTDPSRHDGLGMGRKPFVGESSDVALTKPAQFAEEQRAKSEAAKARAQVMQDQKKIALEKRLAEIRARKAEREQALREQLDEQTMFNAGQHPLLLEAVVQGRSGIDYDAVHSLSGFGLSGDGQVNVDAMRGFGSAGDFNMWSPEDAMPLVGQIVPVSEFDQPVDDGRTYRGMKGKKQTGTAPVGGLFDSITDTISKTVDSATQTLQQSASSYLQKAVSSIVGPSAEEIERQRQLELQRIQAEAQAKAIAQYEAQKAAAEAKAREQQALIASQGFMTQYKTPLLVGGGLLAMALVYKLAQR